jgi:hypothetical protein
VKEQKLQQLMTAARADLAPALSPGFEGRLMRALRQQGGPEPVSVSDQLGELFPRLALAAALVIGLCLATDFCLSKLGPMDLSEGITQVSEQWLFAVR